MKRVLVLCTGNSCRSQMAEALLNHELGSYLIAESAGISPQPAVAPQVIEVLRRHGISTDRLYPKEVTALLDRSYDLIVTVCDHARDTCPVFPRPVPTLHTPFPDPHGQPLSAFLDLFDAMRRRLLPAVAAALSLPLTAGTPGTTK
ncbi:MAG: arsenate reductase ArsC [Hydrogenophilus sp.]|nr:arsenate reductase ArsC [Hydrogenophilus sp.]